MKIVLDHSSARPANHRRVVSFHGKKGASQFLAKLRPSLDFRPLAARQRGEGEGDIHVSQKVRCAPARSPAQICFALARVW